MTNTTDTERNEAIDKLEDVLKRTDFEISLIDEETCDEIHKEYLSTFKSEKTAFVLAIFALRSQSETERKIEKVREYCKGKMKVQFETEYSEGYVNGANNTTNEILKLLEGKTDERK